MMSGLLLKVLMLYKFIEKCDLVIRAYQEQVKSEAEFSWPFLPCDSWVIGWVSDAISSVDYWWDNIVQLSCAHKAVSLLL